MDEFYPQQVMQMRLKIGQHGPVFRFHRPNGGSGETLQVEESWSSLHALLAGLRNSQRYLAKKHPLLIWKEGEELHIQVYLPESRVVEECVFSSEQTGKILRMFAEMPSLN